MKFTAVIMPDKKLIRCSKVYNKHNIRCEVVKYKHNDEIADAIKRGVDLLFDSKGVRV